MNRRQFLKSILFTSAGLASGLPAYAGTAVRRTIRCPILMYHYVSPLPEDADRYRKDLTVEPELFESHCAYLSDNSYTTISMEQLHLALTEGEELPEKPVVMTFDDGYIDAYTIATPILMAYRQTGTFFVVSSAVGSPGYLNWQMAAEMLAVGMEIENHTATHPDLRNLGTESLETEIGGAADAIEQALGKRSRFFCYPGGRFNRSVVRTVHNTGHLMAVTTQDGTLHYTSNPLRLRRVRVRGTTGTGSLEWLLNRWV